MADRKRVLLIGWDPDVVDYGKWPELTAEKLRKALEGDRSTLVALGYEAEWCYLEDASTASDVVASSLQQTPYDCVLIGAGVRLDPDSFIIFEGLVNAIHENAPAARICFNTNPKDTAEAVQRWV